MESMYVHEVAIIAHRNDLARQLDNTLNAGLAMAQSFQGDKPGSLSRLLFIVHAQLLAT